MTRKDFNMIAQALADARPLEDNTDAYYTWLTVLFALAKGLRKTNPRFDRERFLDAAKHWEKSYVD